jgi:Ca-activated chloride channel family protein
VTDAALDLVKQLRQDDEAFVAQFKTEPELLKEFTSDRVELEDAIGEMFTSGGTSLLDAVIATADYAHEKGKNRRKALIIITDGLERNSSVKEKEVLDAIKENEVQVYLVGFIDDEEDTKSFFGTLQPKRHATCSPASQMILVEGPSFHATWLKYLASPLALLTTFAPSTWSATYPTNDKRDGSFRSVKVGVNPRENRTNSLPALDKAYHSRKDQP